GKKTKPDREHFRCFTANMITQKLYMPGRCFECPEKLRITAAICKGCKPIMRSDRINVNHLPAEPSARFSMLAECLERELDEGITLSVVYMNKEIGRGCYVLPESVILRMINTFEEVVHTANVELTCKGCTVGMVTVRLSMLMQCQNIDYSDNNNVVNGACYDDDGLLDSQCDASGSTSDPCIGFVSNDDPPTFSESDPDRCRAKGGSESTKLIDMAGPFSIYGREDTGCIKIGSSPLPAAQFTHYSGQTNRLCPQVSVPKLKQMGIKIERECPVCHEDVSWLPKISACPHCGYKPLPVYEEKEYDEKLTADDILKDFFEQLDKPLTMDDKDPCDMPQQVRGSDGHEGFDTIIKDYKTLKQSIKKCMSAPPGTAARAPPKAAKEPSPLTVFTELREMFHAGETDESRRGKIGKICHDACRLAQKAKRRLATKSSKHPCALARKSIKRSLIRKPFKSRIYAPMDPVEHPHQSHEKCLADAHIVPAHMGWLWTHCPLAKHPGWRPGAIRRSIRELMSYFLKDFPVDSIPISKYMSYHRQKQLPHVEGEERPEDLVQVPTLHIEKKNDEYLITLRPLKDAETLKRAANPYVKMKPLRLRIVKNPVLKEMRDMKRCLKNMGFSKCQCHRPVMECYCRSFIDKKRLVDEVQRQCEKRNLEGCEEDLILSDTTDSEAEFDFGVTPPAGLMRPERLKTTHTTHTETQYDENDWAMPTMYPHPPNAQVQYGGCVTGERKGKFNWIYGKGFVHSEPPKPKLKNPEKAKPKRKFPG
ncbi:hypothetical protein KR222_007852, partial [Zaprionus bogoriensis]